MSQPSQTPESATKGTVADAPTGNWVDRHAPRAARPFLRLSRADRPIGTWLLLLPCWWGVLLAAASTGWRLFDLWIIIGCGIGAWLMRGAGCTWNDITDRNIDGAVARTRSRPIPSRQVTVRHAALWMGLQCLLALGILLTFNSLAITLGVASLALVAIYPFAKRFTWWPQVFLGLAFNWGALLAWVAHTGSLAPAPLLLYGAGIAWTLFYDTIYAHQDTEDDALIGDKSTARLFGEDSPNWLRLFMMVAVLLLTLAVIAALIDTGDVLQLVIGLGGAWSIGWHMAWQLAKLDVAEPQTCLRLFRSNRDAGLITALFFAVAVVI